MMNASEMVSTIVASRGAFVPRLFLLPDGNTWLYSLPDRSLAPGAIISYAPLQGVAGGAAQCPNWPISSFQLWASHHLVPLYGNFHKWVRIGPARLIPNQISLDGSSGCFPSRPFRRVEVKSPKRPGAHNSASGKEMTKRSLTVSARSLLGFVLQFAFHSLACHGLRQPFTAPSAYM